jgi:type I restriction enzyme R subunit
MARAASIRVHYRFVGGYHVYTSDDVYGLYVANQDPYVAYDAVAQSLEKLIKLNEDLDCRVEPTLTFPHLPCYRVPRTGRRFQDEKRITIVTLQTLVNEYAKYSAGYFDMVVIDECHRSIYGKWRRALDHFDGFKIGLTATPCIMQDAPDVDDEDRHAIRDTLRFSEVNRPTYGYGLMEAIADGHLVPYEIYRAMTARTAATEGFAVARGEIDWDALDEPTRVDLEALFADRDPLIVDPMVLERKFTIPERNRAMVREFREVLEQGYTGPNGIRRAPDWGKTIVFAVTRRHAETLARMFDQEFADKKPGPTTRYADFVVSGLGPEDTVDGAAKIKRFKKEEFPQILVSVNMLDTGFDCPEVRNLVMARFTHSTTLYQQMRGRGSRLSPGKSRFTMFDFTGVTLRHGDDEIPGYRPESREAAEHRDPRDLLAELRDETAAILSDIEALAAELGKRAA